MARHFTHSSGEFLVYSNAITYTGAFTLSYWYYNDTAPGTGYPNRWSIISSVGFSGSYFNFGVIHDEASGSGIEFIWTHANDAFDFFNTTTYQPNDTGTWHHVLIANDYTAANAVIYVDGVSQAITTGITSSTPEVFPNVTETLIGATSAGEFMDGRIADVALWSGILLNQSEATALAKGARPSTIRSANLQHWWPLDGIVLPEPDLAGLAANMASGNGTTGIAGPPVSLTTPRSPLILPPPLAPLSSFLAAGYYGGAPYGRLPYGFFLTSQTSAPATPIVSGGGTRIFRVRQPGWKW